MQAKYFVRLVIYPLTLYSAFRTYSLIQTTMGGDTVAFVAGLFALAALDGGVLIWSEIAFRVDSETQDKIAKSLVIVDLVGALLAVVAHTMLYVDREAYVDTITTVSVYAIPFIIFLNLGAGFGYFLADPENAIRTEEKRIDREARTKEKRAGLEQQAARREAEAARMQLETTALRYATTSALLGVVQPVASQNGNAGNSAVAMEAEGAPAPKATRKPRTS